jgi:hypothetical protein
MKVRITKEKNGQLVTTAHKTKRFQLFASASARVQLLCRGIDSRPRTPLHFIAAFVVSHLIKHTNNKISMKTIISILTIQILLLGCISNNSSKNLSLSSIVNKNQDSSENAKIKTYATINQIPEYKDCNLVSTQCADVYDINIYGILQISCKNDFSKGKFSKHTLLFVRFIGEYKGIFQVLDSLVINCKLDERGFDNEFIGMSTCLFNDKEDPEIIGLFKLGEGLDTVCPIKAWRADKAKQKIYEIDTNKIKYFIEESQVQGVPGD